MRDRAFVLAVVVGLVVAVCLGGCGGGAGKGGGGPAEQGKVFAGTATATISFAAVQALPSGTPMKVLLNRKGSTVTEYPVTLLSSYSIGGDRLILCQAGAGLTVGAGDSGSPLLTQDNKVAGALAYGWTGNNTNFEARSIDDMIGLVGTAAVSGEPPASAAKTAIAPAYYVRGLSSDQLKRLSKYDRNGTLGRFTSVGATSPVSSATEASLSAVTPVTPGQSIAVEYLYGPLIDVGVIGAVTFRTTQDKLLIFGHPLDMIGTRALPVRPVWMDAMIDTTLGSFKQAHPIAGNVGALVDDRKFGCVVDPAVTPSTFACNTSVSINGGAPVVYRHTAATMGGSSDEILLALMAQAASLDQQFGKYGDGTATGKLYSRFTDESTFTSYNISITCCTYGDVVGSVLDEVDSALWDRWANAPVGVSFAEIWLVVNING